MAVNYDTFKSGFMMALQQSRLPMIGLRGHETLDPDSLNREYVVYVEPIGREMTPPFHVSASVSFRWTALLTARMTTIEEDVLVELLGREDAEGLDTEQPWVRVDTKLRAGLEWGKSLPMPSAKAWATWIRETLGRLENVERIVSDDVVREIPDGGHAVLAWQGDPRIKIRCNPDGELRLEEVEVHAFQGIDLPRQWDDSDRDHDDDPDEQLAAMFKRVRAALFAWGEMVDHLLPPILGRSREPM